MNSGFYRPKTTRQRTARAPITLAVCKSPLYFLSAREPPRTGIFAALFVRRAELRPGHVYFHSNAKYLSFVPLWHHSMFGIRAMLKKMRFRTQTSAKGNECGCWCACSGGTNAARTTSKREGGREGVDPKRSVEGKVLWQYNVHVFVLAPCCFFTATRVSYKCAINWIIRLYLEALNSRLEKSESSYKAASPSHADTLMHKNIKDNMGYDVLSIHANEIFQMEVALNSCL